MAVSEWQKAKKEIKRLLSERARMRGMIPYSELASKIQSMDLEAHDIRLFQLLGEISTEEDRNARGMLPVYRGS